MKQFEYIQRPIVASYKLSGKKKDEWKLEGILETQLNKYGAKGWELVHIDHIVATRSKELHICIFKREIIKKSKPTK